MYSGMGTEGHCELDPCKMINAMKSDVCLKFRENLKSAAWADKAQKE